MSTSTTSPLSGGVQQLYKDGLLPSNLSASTLNSASASQLNKIAGSAIALQEVGTILGFGSGTTATDSATLSPTAANSLLSNSIATSTLTAAVDNALTYKINAAVNQFDQTNSSTSSASGSQINVLG